MPHSVVFVALLIACLTVPSLAGAGESRGRRSALVGGLAAAALTGPTGMAIGMAIGANASLALQDVITRNGGAAMGVDPMPTCGTPSAAARQNAGAARKPC
jgi:hypothetical protein